MPAGFGSGAASSASLNMGSPLDVGGGGHFDGVRADDRHDDDLGAGGQLAAGGDGLAFQGAVLQVEGNFADAGPLGGDRQVDGAALAHGPLDADGAVGAEPGQGPHQRGDQDDGRAAGGQGQA